MSLCLRSFGLPPSRPRTSLQRSPRLTKAQPFARRVTCRRLGVIREEVETVTVESLETTSSPQTQPITTDSGEEIQELINNNGLAVLKEPENTQTPPEPSPSRDFEKLKDDKSYEDRFKLRNGREVFEEKTYLVGVERKGEQENLFGTEESLKELAQLADTAGLLVVGSTSQKLATPNSRTYIGSGKVVEIKNTINALDVETVIFDDELSAGQLRNLEKAFGGDIRVCDRTALILDIFNQRAATHEAALQVALAQMEYQLPRLTKMWTHLERQAGGQVKGMGEKQIEVDKRILRTQIGSLKKELESVRKHRKQYRSRRFSVPVPVVSLVGYTNAGKSTLLNKLTGANVLAEDRLFATLDPTTRRVQTKNGKEFLLTDTVGFIQKLPTTLVAAFRATLEEISESSLLVHVVDISHPLAQQQIDAVEKVLSELDVASIPKLMVWNKVDKVGYPHQVKMEAEEREDVICISALNGDGLHEFCNAVHAKLKDSMVWVEALVPFEKGELLNTIHQVGMVEGTEYQENGTLIRAHVPLPLARQLTPMRLLCKSSPQIV
ncbi:GTPase HflX [Telopea speciosissima]|uniref:GTPase HflX n=1 Tax=Telopea speciosissima TaxID=54955 RepID=UPI001CC40545|nr:GTPase HflX [Telopea speciosissima]XP_043709945.1 GTPase HflX [Telopea speciosissima]